MSLIGAGRRKQLAKLMEPFFHAAIIDGAKTPEDILLWAQTELYACAVEAGLCSAKQGQIQQGLDRAIERMKDVEFRRPQRGSRDGIFSGVLKPPGMVEETWKLIKEKACCPKARVLPCVCVYAFTCPDHNNTHIGSHE